MMAMNKWGTCCISSEVMNKCIIGVNKEWANRIQSKDGMGNWKNDAVNCNICIFNNDAINTISMGEMPLSSSIYAYY